MSNTIENNSSNYVLINSNQMCNKNTNAFNSTMSSDKFCGTVDNLHQYFKAQFDTEVNKISFEINGFNNFLKNKNLLSNSSPFQYSRYPV